MGWKNTVAFGVWQTLSNYFSNTLGLAKADWILPNAFFPYFGTQVYFKENLIRMFLIYLFFSHQIIVLKQWVNAQEDLLNDLMKLL